MTTPEQPFPFDVLSYPRRSATDLLLVDVGDESTSIAADLSKSGHNAAAAHQAQTIAACAVLSELNGVPPNQTMLVSDRGDVAENALKTGMGVTHVAGREGAAFAFDTLLEPSKQSDEVLYKAPLYSALSYEEVAESFFVPGAISVVGFVGRTGAGKSTTIRRLIDAVHTIGGDGGLFEVDSFFVRSRADRKAWLNEPDISDEERADRQRVITWWDLGRATNTLERIQSGEHVRLEGLYDMQNAGEMVGSMDIDPGNRGYTVFVEGTALLVPEFDAVIDSFVYLNTHDQVRAELLMQRNTRHGYSPQESRERKILTDAAETNEHIAAPLRTNRFLKRNLVVLDNTDRRDHLRLMPPYIPKK
jgi:uridine kinase